MIGRTVFIAVFNENGEAHAFYWGSEYGYEQIVKED